MIRMDEIIPGLYVGSVADVYNKDIDIKICVLNKDEVCPSGTIHIPFLEFSIEGVGVFPTVDHLDKNNLDRIADIVDDALKSGKKVLIFCMAGIDRSPFAVVYYLMTKKNMMAHEAYNMIKQKRKIINQHWDWFGIVR